VCCAVEIGTSLAGTDGSDVEPLKMRFGVHLADVAIDGDDLVGDSVNLTARPAQHAQARLSTAWAWYKGLPRLTAGMITLVVLLFLINVFSGVDHVWFHWPAVPLLLIAILWAAIQRQPS
jgi:hypothetical protein